MFFVCFLFFRQKTAYEMRISDWSSDVCSSDLLAPAEPMSVALSREQAARLGIESVALAVAPVGTAISAFARVVDPQPLFQSLSDRAVAQAALRASEANRQRLSGLYEHDGNASLQELEAARASRAQDRKSVV